MDNQREWAPSMKPTDVLIRDLVETMDELLLREKQINGETKQALNEFTHRGTINLRWANIAERSEYNLRRTALLACCDTERSEPPMFAERNAEMPL